MNLKSLKNYALFLLLQPSLFAFDNTIYLELGSSFGLDDTVKSSNEDYIYDKSLSGSVIVGYQYQEHRFEFEERYKESSLIGVKLNSGLNLSKDGDMTTSSHLVNYYYNGYNQSKFISSIGFGAGISSVDLDGMKENALFSMQGMFSVGLMVSEKFILTTKYTYLYTMAGDTLDANKDSSIALSVRYLF